MKNIHLIETDKPSRLHITGNLNLYPNGVLRKPQGLCKNQHFYITNSEEIKEGVDQWYLDKVLNEPYNSGGAQYSSKQNVIILTTDQDLIKDGVQAIDDEFLEWFVKNPSCEKVEVEHFGTCCGNQFINQCINCEKYNPIYKLIIPQEEPKQEISEEAKKRAANYMSLKGALEHKQETIEEIIKK